MRSPDPDKLAALLQQLAAVKETHARLLGLVADLVGPTGDPAACRLAREGEYWSVGYAGSVARIRDCKGLGYLAQLVARPHVEIHATDLTGAIAEAAIPGLDRQARAAYEHRLAELHDREDPASRAEVAAIAGEVARAVGLGGRDRAAGAAERARINATRTIKDAIGRIARADRDLGRHLAVSVRTGAFCCYEPHVARTWLLT